MKVIKHGNKSKLQDVNGDLWVRVLFICDDITHSMLKIISKKDGRSIKWHINQALKEYCEKIGK